MRCPGAGLGGGKPQSALKDCVSVTNKPVLKHKLLGIRVIFGKIIALQLASV